MHLTIHNLLIRPRPRSIGAIAVALSLVVAAPAAAQIRRTGPSVADTNPLMGGVPTGTLSPEPLRLTAADAIFRALEHNLGVLALGAEHRDGTQ